jgi:hypothetical protein
MIQHRWRSLTTRTLSSSSRRRVCDHAFADRVRSERSGWTGQAPDAVRVEGPPESGVAVPEHKLEGGDARSARSISRLRASWVVHAPVGCALTSSRCARREPCSTAIRT